MAIVPVKLPKQALNQNNYFYTEKNGMLMTRTFILLFALIFQAVVKPVAAQLKEGDPVGNQLILQLDDLKHLADIEKSYAYANLASHRVLSVRLKLVLVSFDPQKTEASVLLGQIRHDKHIVNAQLNHIVSLRETENTPDDPLFYNQWNMNNTGQNGGTPGADIDALRAWDITTGGVTALGDTIVVAVIDGGCDQTHPDIDLFVNRQEIPNNGIDDDGNNYIDDYYGWNAYDNTGSQPTSVHATHVSGIVGARGNNADGVSGVNWRVKVLSVAGSSSNESTVVAAYSYVYEMRSLYDETSGAKGAFIVATNGSFGVNQGQPENYPIWEAMLDSLGAIGVLNAGATANLDVDVDSVGDIPTAFETPYLIAVTNTTKTDDRYFSAAYGLQSIDLGAPGTLIFSSILNSGYGYKTGTSMATPHVAGAVALLYSAADSAFMVNYRNNPAAVALQMKQFILDGTDPIAGLEGKSVTGGRLNLYNSLMKLLNNPQLNVDPLLIDTAILLGNNGSAGLTVSNTGGDTLMYALNIPAQPAWISLGEYSGQLAAGASETITLNFNSAGLDTGNYVCEVVVTAEGFEPVMVPVNLLIYSDVGIEEGAGSSGYVAVFPNPFSSVINWEYTGMKGGNIRLEITDITGKTVFGQQQNDQGPSGRFQWHGKANDGQQLPAGIYLYTLKSAESFKRGKIMLK